MSKTEDGERLVRDPALPWATEWPYERLSRRLAESRATPVTPESSAEVVHDALFDLMQMGTPSHEDRLAWDQLRDPYTRTLLDFFMYAVPAGEDVTVDPRAWDLPMPVYDPGLDALLDMSIEPEPTLVREDDLDPGPLPPPLSIDSAKIAATALRIPSDWKRIREGR